MIFFRWMFSATGFITLRLRNIARCRPFALTLKRGSLLTRLPHTLSFPYSLYFTHTQTHSTLKHKFHIESLIQYLSHLFLFTQALPYFRDYLMANRWPMWNWRNSLSLSPLSARRFSILPLEHLLVRRNFICVPFLWNSFFFSSNSNKVLLFFGP